MKKLRQFILENLSQEGFAVIKPGFLKYESEITKAFKTNNIEVLDRVEKKLSLEEAERLYVIHKAKDFYKDLCEYMSEDKTVAFKLSGENVVAEVKKIKKEMREKYGESEMKNVMHSSDRVDNVKKETEVYF